MVVAFTSGLLYHTTHAQLFLYIYNNKEDLILPRTEKRELPRPRTTNLIDRECRRRSHVSISIYPERTSPRAP